jgi:hypothetical protein
VSARFTWNGLDELKVALQTLPADLTTAAQNIVFDSAKEAANAIILAYPHKTGNLSSHVTVSRAGGAFSTSAKVKNTAKHAWLYDNGSSARHYYTKGGVSHATGAMPATHLFVSRIVQQRRVMYERLKALLVSHGLLVSGDAAA